MDDADNGKDNGTNDETSNMMRKAQGTVAKGEQSNLHVALGGGGSVGASVVCVCIFLVVDNMTSGINIKIRR